MHIASTAFWQPPLKPALPLRAKIVKTEGARFLLETGKVFRYQVALTNTSSSAFRFRDCPMYHEGALPTGPTAFWVASSTYMLNCRSVGEMKPGETVTFAFELPVPKTAYPTRGALVWTLAPDSKNPPTAKVPVVIVKGFEYSPSARYGVFATGEPEASFSSRIRREAGFARDSAGPTVKGSRRILLVRPGKVNTIVYAFLTESGKACYGVLGDLASCDGGADQTAPFTWSAGGPAGGPRIIAGLAGDGVKSIDVIVNGQSWLAKLANNAFYIEVPFDHKHTITSIVATMEDGSQKKTGVGPLR
jgi:hypothetical protein